MLRERYSKVEFNKIFQSFNEAVYRGEMKKLNYKSWRNIKNWLSDEIWSKMEVSKEWVRIRDDGSDTNPYAYHDEERIFVGPYDDSLCCPNPEELHLNDNSFGAWLDGVLNSKRTMANLSSTFESISYSATKAADSCMSLNDVYYTDTTSTKLITNDQYIYNTPQDWQPWTVDVNTDSLQINGDSLEEYIKKTVNKSNNSKNEKENKKDMKFGNFDFGPVNSEVHMSMYGMAIKNASGTYVSYDVANKRLMDVDIVNFEGANKFMYKMPAAMKDIAVGDIVVHARKPMFVTEITSEGKLIVIDPTAGEEKTIMLAHSPFGFNFVTKVVSLLNFGGADKDNPFGNMLPFILLSDSNGKDNDVLLMMALMGNGTNSFANNPMMLWALMGNRTNDPMMLALMTSQCGFGAQPSGCNGNCHCHDEK